MINKFDKAVAKDWSWNTIVPKLPELDVKGLEDVMQQNQSQIDQISLISEKKPNVLNNAADMKLYQEYKSDIDNGLESVSNAYKQGVANGSLEYKRLLSKIRSDWSPGGRAYALNSRYAAYGEANKQIEDFYKDDTNPVNKTLAKKELADQLKSDISFDPATGTFTTISTPNTYKNPNINKAIDTMLNEIKANGDTQLLGSDKDWWIKKIQTETREPERIKLAFQALSQQPEYASQIDRDVKYKSLTTDKDAYIKAFNEGEANRISNLESSINSAKNDPSKVKDLQQELRDAGYNVDVDGKYGPLTQSAIDSYLSDSKKKSQERIDNFDYNSSLRQDVYKSYENYATRGAFQKREVTPIFNQAKKAMLDDLRKREENAINRDRLNFEFADRDQSQITVVDGVAQQLPKIDKYHDDLKKQETEYLNGINKTISNSPTFKGWTLDNVALAYQKWSKVEGATEAEKIQNFKNLLNENGSYQFNDRQVESLYQEMNAPRGEGALLTALEQYGNIRSEKSRIEETQNEISSQYILTPEGKENVKRLNEFRQPGESDLDLVRRVTTNPEQFRKTRLLGSAGGGYESTLDVGEAYRSNMRRDVEKQQKNGMKYDLGTLGTYEVYTGNTDKSLKPTLDAVAKAIETGTGNNFSSFGLSGLNFKDNKGEDLPEGEAKKVMGMGVTKNIKGEPILKVNVNVTKKDGKSKDGYTEIALVPNSALAGEIKRGLTNAYVQKYKNGEIREAAGILDNIDAIEGKDGLKQASIDKQLKSLNLKNTSRPNNMYIKSGDEIIPVSTLGWQVRDLEDDALIQGRQFKTFGAVTKTGNYLLDVYTNENGDMIVVPNNGSNIYTSSSGIAKQRLSKRILSDSAVEVTKTKK